MDMSFIEIAKQFIGDYWPHVTGVVVPAVATAIFSHIRRPKSTARDTGPYFTEAELLTPPLVRPAYSDRMAYVLAEMSDLAYYQFEGEGGFIEDAVCKRHSNGISPTARTSVSFWISSPRS